MSRRRLKIAALLVVGTLATVIVIAAVLFATLGPRVLVEEYASLSLGRRLSIGTLRIGWGNPTTIELRDLRLANRPGGSTPDMVTIDRLSAEVEPWSLLRGYLRFRHLDVSKPVVVLERDANGTGNWRFRRVGLTLVQRVSRSRAHFPTLLDFHLHGGEVTYRSSAGAIRIDMQEGAIRADGDDTPATVSLDGAYNGIPSQLAGETQGFATMRDSSKPFGLSFSLSGATSRIDFKGTLQDPLNFDGADGTLAIEGEDLGQFLNVFQAGLAAPIPYSIAGPFQRAGDHWQLADARGRLASSDFAGSAIRLQEGRRGQPDDLALDLRFPDLDLQQMLIAGGYDPSKPTGDIGSMSLRLDESGGTNIDASIAAKQLSYGTLRLADLAVRGTLAAGQAALKRATFAFANGKIEASGDASTVPAGTRIAASARLSGLDASPLAQLLGADAGQITGSVDGGATLEMTGDTVADALKTSQGAAVLAMRRGSVARSLLERASTDIRSLFRKSAGAAPVRCLLGVVSLHDGLGAVAPLRLATNEATLIGGGQLDLPRGTLDLTVKSNASGPLALDIPFRVSGDLAAPSVRPVIGGSTAWLDAPAQNAVPADLPPDLQQLAAANPC